ncbi:MAG: hypothetical protein HC838_06485 [Spirulinaceae cyanobacterium RM2_2_10]|nr:hypothetical protein [Spirulinaceae cyanobacterium RM2_2_10]
MSSCNKILKIARRRQLKLVFTNLSDKFRAQLQQGEGVDLLDAACSLAPETVCYQFADMDRGLEWCEQQILQSATVAAPARFALAEHLQSQFLGDRQEAATFMTYLQPRTVAADCEIFAPAAHSHSLHFVASGQVSVLLELATAGTKRLQTVIAGGVTRRNALLRQVPPSRRKW